MQETLEDFFRALRAADIPVSPAEAIDAHRAVDEGHPSGGGGVEDGNDGEDVQLGPVPDQGGPVDLHPVDWWREEAIKYADAKRG